MMKRPITALIAVGILGVTLSACGSAAQSDSAANPSTSSGTTSTETAVSPDTAVPNWEDYLAAKVVKFTVSKQECSYDDGTLELLVELKNTSTRDIAAIQARAGVTDLFDEEISGYNISSDEPLAAGKTAKVGSWGSSCFGLNRFDSDDSRLLDMTNVAEQTKVVVSVTKIAFKDGEVLEF